LVDEYLTELIVLNIGLSLGVISPLLFYNARDGAGNDIYDLAPIGVDLSEKLSWIWWSQRLKKRQV